jgi:hypothetical protein
LEKEQLIKLAKKECAFLEADGYISGIVDVKINRNI